MYDDKRVRLWIGDQYHYMPQMGKDLGERMKNAFLPAFQRGFKIVGYIRNPKQVNKT